MGDHGNHRDSEHCMTGRKRRVYIVVTPEIPISIALPWTLASRDELHWRINKESVHEGFHLERSHLLQVLVVGLYAIAPGKRESGSSAAQGDIRKVSIDIDVPARKMSLNAPIGG